MKVELQRSSIDVFCSGAAYLSLDQRAFNLVLNLVITGSV